MEVENNTIIIINRELIENNLEDWSDGYLKLENGHLSDHQLDELTDKLYENLVPFLQNSFMALEWEKSESNTKK